MKNKMNSKKIIEEIEGRKEEIISKGVKKIALFGSFSKNQAGKKSDIDILVKFNKKTFNNYIELKILLEKIFRRKIDLVIEENLRPKFRYIIKEAKYARI